MNIIRENQDEPILKSIILDTLLNNIEYFKEHEQEIKKYKNSFTNLIAEKNASKDASSQIVHNI